MTTDFEEGEVYYCIKYSDGAMLYPVIETFVFLGKFDDPEDGVPLWYFQPADSFARFGSVLANQGGDRKCWPLPEERLQDMCDFETAIQEIRGSSLRRRRKTKGHP